MLGEKAVELIEELNKNHDIISPFNENLVRQTLQEIQILFTQNQKDVNLIAAGESNYLNSIYIRHVALERNKRCLLAYLYNRIFMLRQIRWDFGSILPKDIQANLCKPEIQWFMNYSRNVALYMRSLGERKGVNITMHMQPPISLFLHDYGDLETHDGDFVVLKQDNQYYLPSYLCEPLIRQGIFEHIQN